MVSLKEERRGSLLGGNVKWGGDAYLGAGTVTTQQDLAATLHVTGNPLTPPPASTFYRLDYKGQACCYF